MNFIEHIKFEVNEFTYLDLDKASDLHSEEIKDMLLQKEVNHKKNKVVLSAITEAGINENKDKGKIRIQLRIINETNEKYIYLDVKSFFKIPNVDSDEYLIDLLLTQGIVLIAEKINMLIKSLSVLGNKINFEISAIDLVKSSVKAQG